jgi:hypothetical protein
VCLFLDCVEELSSEFNNSGIAIDDDNQTCQRLCGKVEQFLSIGFIGRCTDWRLEIVQIYKAYLLQNNNI